MLPTDIELVYEWRNDPGVRKFMFDGAPLDHNSHADWFDKAHRNPLRHLLLVCRRGQPFGFVQFTVNSSRRVADWGFYADPKGPKGQGKILGHAALDYGFKIIGLHKVCGQVIEKNLGSIRFHERFGFIAEGILRSHHLSDNGYQDVHLFGLLASEWESSTDRTS